MYDRFLVFLLIHGGVIMLIFWRLCCRIMGMYIVERKAMTIYQINQMNISIVT